MDIHKNARLTPHSRADLVRRVLEEILDEKVGSSRGRRNPRAVKRKVGKFPIAHRQTPLGPKGKITFEDHIVTIK